MTCIINASFATSIHTRLIIIPDAHTHINNNLFVENELCLHNLIIKKILALDKIGFQSHLKMLLLFITGKIYDFFKYFEQSVIVNNPIEPVNQTTRINCSRANLLTVRG